MFILGLGLEWIYGLIKLRLGTVIAAGLALVFIFPLLLIWLQQWSLSAINGRIFLLLTFWLILSKNPGQRSISI